MMNYIQNHPWKIIQNEFLSENGRFYESIFSIGNGKMGQRANFEEDYSGDTMQGSYIAGLYYPDKTRVGWWKNGYPEYFAKVINSVNWIGIRININGENLDLAKAQVMSFHRELDMQHGVLHRKAQVRLQNGVEVELNTTRFCSIKRDQLGCIRYQITALNQDIKLEITPYLDNHVLNEDSNYDEAFWEYLEIKSQENKGFVKARTTKLNWITGAAFTSSYKIDQEKVSVDSTVISSNHSIGFKSEIFVKQKQQITVDKFCSVLANLNHEEQEMESVAYNLVDEAASIGFETLLNEHADVWLDKWLHHDIEIKGDVSAQQGIRFNIFQLNQTYTGADSRLNIGPKGFTGEKYGGSTYWDTEAYCIPYYLGTAEPNVARNLLIYRYKHLTAAIENAAKLGFSDGAALYPMVTMNGEECHNEWEITFEEIHRNGAMAYAIYDYIRYTGDWSYIPNHGLEVLIAISRFWSQRVNYSKQKNKYVMLGVTGPNEYENNVNNNWYTNYLAIWCLNFTQRMIEFCSNEYPEELSRIVNLTNLSTESDLNKWQDIASNMYFPYDDKREVFLQQDGFLDKSLVDRKSIPSDQIPIWKNWSWDRILRSCFIKQADVLQGLFLFDDDFDKETIRRNYDYYEPMTVHESSLSPCIHSIHAALLGRISEAYELYIRTARLDLDNLNNDTDDGCHITSMAGTWMSIVKGFGGFRIRDNIAYFNPVIPEQWEALRFKLYFRGRILEVNCTTKTVEIKLSGDPLELFLYDNRHTVTNSLTIDRKN